LSAALSAEPGIMVAPFGTSLHISARDKGTLKAAIKPYRGDPALKWTASEPSLEDVFIDLMGRAKDNFQ
jgi:ABC-2 type transport system ATP-binding protein